MVPVSRNHRAGISAPQGTMVPVCPSFAQPQDTGTNVPVSWGVWLQPDAPPPVPAG